MRKPVFLDLHMRKKILKKQTLEDNLSEEVR